MAGLKFFLLGHPVSQSRSPAMQNAALAHLRVDGLYGTLDVLPGDLESTLERLDSEPDVVGCNVTVPHKTAVHRWLESRGRELLPRARVAGAVNTLFRGTDGCFHGDSTDFDGAMDAILREAFGDDEAAIVRDLPTRDVAVLGSGGSAVSIAANIVHPWSPGPIGDVPLEGVRPRSLTIFARKPDKARAVAEAAANQAIPVDIASLADFPAWNAHRHSLVFQTTTVGMDSGEMPGMSPIPSGSFAPGQIAFDLVYKPHDTPFLRDAAGSGAIAVHGIGMLVGQGARSLARWRSSLGTPCVPRSVAGIMAAALGVP